MLFRDQNQDHLGGKLDPRESFLEPIGYEESFLLVPHIGVSFKFIYHSPMRRDF